MEKLVTPMMKQYQQIKSKYPDSILFFRLGDFYEMFFKDAEIASQVLEIALTSRPSGDNIRIPMCGIPYHSVNKYLPKLLAKGLKVTICDQTEQPQKGKKIVKREVIRTISPGTLVDDFLLDDKKNNFLACLCIRQNKIALSLVDISTGDFLITSTNLENKQKILEEIYKLSPAEIIAPQDLKENVFCKTLQQNFYFTFIDNYLFELEANKNILLSHFGLYNLDGLGITEQPEKIIAGGIILDFLNNSQKKSAKNINTLRNFSLEDYLSLDNNTKKNLELTESFKGEKEGSLLAIIDHTLTPMGGRRIRNFLEHPLLNIEEIKNRQQFITKFYENFLLTEEIRFHLKKINDLERVLSRFIFNIITPREIINFKNSIFVLQKIKEIIDKENLSFMLISPFDNLADIYKLLEESFTDNFQISFKEIGFIKDGFHPEIDNLRTIQKKGKKIILELEATEKEKTGIKSLKVSYNNVFGYFIEVTKPNLHLVPKHYIRKQTTAGGERFITEKLKNLEEEILNAEEKLFLLETKVFAEIKNKIISQSDRIKKTAENISLLDVYSSLAELSLKNNYQKPEINNGEEIIIQDGRHPVVEKYCGENFVPNNTYLNLKDCKIMLLTGPNMAGKSTFLRQIALLVLLAQTGSFIPATTAKIGLVDKIFTRIGAYDELISGKSTFMVEMNETSYILNNATCKSLIILDEIGRGTSTYDGLSIAYAVIIYILTNKKISARTLFATHYHELTKLENNFSGIQNFNVAVKEEKDNLIFLHKIIKGAADKSYGIQVAKIAGLPDELLNTAKIFLSSLEKKISTEKESKLDKKSTQLSLFEENYQKLLFEIKELKPENLTPLQAMEKLFSLQKKADEFTE